MVNRVKSTILPLLRGNITVSGIIKTSEEAGVNPELFSQC